MALDFAGLKAAVVALSPSQISAAAAGDAVNRAYQTLLASRPGGGSWFGLKKTTTFATVVDKTAGSITLTQGSANVIGVGTAFAQSDVNRFLAVGDRQPLRILSVQGVTQLTLQQPWGEATLPPGTKYKIANYRYQLPTDADRVLRLTGPLWTLPRRSQALLDVWDPNRVQRGNPVVFAEAELLSANSSAASLPTILEGTQAIVAGAVTADVAIGDAGTSGYQISITPSWQTSYAIRSGRTAQGFTVDFAVPAPVTGNFDWVVFIPGATQGASLIQTVLEIEMWPVPDQAVTFFLEYKKRVEDLVADSDVPVLSPQYVMHGARVEMCMAMFSKTGDAAWDRRAQSDVGMAGKILESLIREDRRMRGSHPVALDSEDGMPNDSAAWWQAWRIASALASGSLA